MPVAAQGTSITISAQVNPLAVKEGDSVRITVTVLNNLGKDIDGYFVQIFIYIGGTPGQATVSKPLTVVDGMSVDIIYDWKAKEGKYSLMVLVVDGDNMPVGDTYEHPNPITVTKENGGNGNIFDMVFFGIPFLFLLVIIIFVVVLVVVVAIKMRKKKRKGLEITGEGVEIQGRVAWGKMPENYYKERRERLSKLRPVGLTRDGRTIMGNPKEIVNGVSVDTVDHTGDATTTRACSKCGFEMDPTWKTCMKCDASSSIKDTKNMMKNPIFQGHNLDFAETLVRQADAAFEGENFTEASMFSLDARTKVEEYRRKVEADKRVQDEAAKQEAIAKGIAPPVEAKPTAPTVKAPESCTGCGMGMQSDWAKCPVCGLAVQDMLKPKEEPKVVAPPPVAQVYCCSTCGNEKSTVDAPCVHCNTGHAVTNAEKKVKELRLIIVSVTMTSEDQLEVNEAFDLFADTKGAYQDKDYNTAVGLAGETIEMVDELIHRLKTKMKVPTAAPQQPGLPPKPVQPTPQQVQTAMALADNKCPKCGLSVKPNWEICPQCDTQLRTPTPATATQKTCPKCNKPVKDRWTICPFCESPLK